MDRKSSQRRKQVAQEMSSSDNEYVALLNIVITHFVPAASTPIPAKELPASVKLSSHSLSARFLGLGSPSTPRHSSSSATPSSPRTSATAMILSEDERKMLFGNFVAVHKCATELATAVCRQTSSVSIRLSSTKPYGLYFLCGRSKVALTSGPMMVAFRQRLIRISHGYCVTPSIHLQIVLLFVLL
jgi:hypothetical protein